jgi:hypothetical protein
MRQQVFQVALGVALCAAQTVLADATFQQLNAKAAEALLTDKTLKYSDATQTFNASGRTVYTTSRPSWGYWSIRGAQYCSQWPPNSEWACFDLWLSEDGKTARFVDAWDNATDGRFVE